MCEIVENMRNSRIFKGEIPMAITKYCQTNSSVSSPVEDVMQQLNVVSIDFCEDKYICGYVCAVRVT